MATKNAVFVADPTKFCLSSTKNADFVDGNGKMSLPSMKMAVFLADGPGYLLYLHDSEFFRIYSIIRLNST